MQEHEKLWKQYEKHLDLYKFYLELVVKVNTFHFAISGALISFYVANQSISTLKWSLILPAMLSLCLVIVYFLGACSNNVSRNDVINLRDSLGLKVAPELKFLTYFLIIFAIANLLTFAGIMTLMFCEIKY